MLITTKMTKIANIEIRTVTVKPLNMYDALGGLQELKNTGPSVVLDVNQDNFYVFSKDHPNGWARCEDAELREFGTDGVSEGVALTLRINKDTEFVSDQALADVLMKPEAYEDVMCNVKVLIEGIRSLIKEDDDNTGVK